MPRGGHGIANGRADATVGRRDQDRSDGVGRTDEIAPVEIVEAGTRMDIARLGSLYLKHAGPFDQGCQLAGGGHDGSGAAGAEGGEISGRRTKYWWNCQFSNAAANPMATLKASQNPGAPHFKCSPSQAPRGSPRPQ